jgi:hypothetical protein
MSVQPIERYLTSPELAAALSERGISCHPATPLEWSRRYPGISIRVGHRIAFPARTLSLLLSGVPLPQIPARLRDERGDQATLNLMAAE